MRWDRPGHLWEKVFFEMTRLTAVEKLIDLLTHRYGSRSNALAAIDEQFEEELYRWNQPTNSIGRVLRCHLYVEYHLTKVLETQNPNLGSLDDARLTFAQKISLINHPKSGFDHLVVGLRRLNTIRNKVSHRLSIEITDADKGDFLSNPLFLALRSALARPGEPSDNTMDIIEEFAKYAGGLMHAATSPDGDIWREAMSEIKPESEFSQ